MVFVHSRRETLTTAEFFINKAESYNELELYFEFFLILILKNNSKVVKLLKKCKKKPNK